MKELLLSKVRFQSSGVTFVRTLISFLSLYVMLNSDATEPKRKKQTNKQTNKQKDTDRTMKDEGWMRDSPSWKSSENCSSSRQLQLNWSVCSRSLLLYVFRFHGISVVTISKTTHTHTHKLRALIGRTEIPGSNNLERISNAWRN